MTIEESTWTLSAGQILQMLKETAEENGAARHGGQMTSEPACFLGSLSTRVIRTCIEEEATSTLASPTTRTLSVCQSSASVPH